MSDERPRSIFSTLNEWRKTLWRYIITGMLVWVPLIITIWVSWFVIDRLGVGLEKLFRRIFELARGFSGNVPVLQDLAPALHYRPGMGLVTAILLFLLTGILTRYLVGRRIIAYGERILNRVPLVSRVYRSVQQIRDVFVGRGGAVFQRVCLIDYPREGMTAIAFVTSSEQGLVQRAVGKELIAVFVPTTPNPTSGYLIYLPPNDVRPLDISVEEAMKLIVSGGAYIPPERTLPVAPGPQQDEAGGKRRPGAGASGEN